MELKTNQKLEERVLVTQSARNIFLRWILITLSFRIFVEYEIYESLN